MTEINIAGSIDELMIFDDPEYCSGNGKCYFIHGYFLEPKWCFIYKTFLKHKKFKPAKCNQCKTDCLKAKRIQEDGEAALIVEEAIKEEVDDWRHALYENGEY